MEGSGVSPFGLVAFVLAAGAEVTELSGSCYSSKDHCDLGFEGMCRAIWIGCNAFDDGIVDGMMIMLMLMMTMLMTVVMM